MSVSGCSAYRSDVAHAATEVPNCFCNTIMATGEAAVRIVSGIASGVSYGLNSLDLTAGFLRAVTAVSSLAKEAFQLAEYACMEAFSSFTSVVRASRLFTVPQYILGGDLWRDITEGKICKLAARVLWTTCGIIGTRIFFDSSKKDQTISVDGKQVKVTQIAEFGGCVASFCAVANTIQEMVTKKGWLWKDICNITSNVIDGIGSIISLGCPESEPSKKITTAVCNALSNSVGFIAQLLP